MKQKGQVQVRKKEGKALVQKEGIKMIYQSQLHHFILSLTIFNNCLHWL